MESAYIFMFIAFAFGVVFGVVTDRARWIAGAVCSAIPVVVLVGSYAMQSRNQLLDTVVVTGPFLIVVAVGYFAIGYAGASIGNRFNLSNPVAERKAALFSFGRRAGVIATVVLGLLFVSYLLVHFMHLS